MLELYKLLLEQFKKGESFYICNCIKYDLKNMSATEISSLLEHFKKQHPTETLYPKFYKHSLFIKHETVGGAWFESPRYMINMGEALETEAFKVRIRLIEAIIQKLESDGCN